MAGYSREQYEADLLALDGLRSEVGRLELAGKLRFGQYHMLHSEIDQSERRCKARIMAARMSAQDKDWKRKNPELAKKY